MSNQIFNKLTNQMTETIESSLSLALHNKNSEVEVIHTLWSMLINTNTPLNQVLNKLNVSNEVIILEAKSYASNLVASSSVSKENIKISRNLFELLEKSESLMSSLGDTFIAVDTFIISALETKVYKDVLGKYANLSEIKKTLETIRAGQNISSANADENLDAINME